MVGPLLPLDHKAHVLPEPFNDNGTWRETIFFDTLNTSYIPLALHAARAADPHAKLYVRSLLENILYFFLSNVDSRLLN